MPKEIKNNVPLNQNLEKLFMKTISSISRITNITKESVGQQKEDAGGTIRKLICKAARAVNNGFINSIDVQLAPLEDSSGTIRQFMRIQPKEDFLFLIERIVGEVKDSQLDLTQNSTELFLFPENKWIEKNSREISNKDLVGNNLGSRTINALYEMARAKG